MNKDLELTTFSTDVGFVNDYTVKPPSPQDFIENFNLFLPLFISKGKATFDTIKDYTFNIRKFLNWAKERDLYPFDITEYQMRYYRNHLINQKEYAPSTINQRLIAIRTFFNMAIKMGYTDKNPVTELDVKVPKSFGQDYVFFSPVELSKLLVQIHNINDPYIRYRNALIIMLMAFQGLRNIEVFKLNDDDIDIDHEIIKVSSKGYAGRRDSIPLLEKIGDIYQNYLRYRPIECQPDEYGAAPLFRSFIQDKYKGKRISRRGLERIVSEMLNKAGLKQKGACCHALRHSCGTNMYNESKDIRAVQEFLRHGSPQVTSRYTHIKNKELIYPAQKVLDRILK